MKVWCLRAAADVIHFGLEANIYVYWSIMAHHHTILNQRALTYLFISGDTSSSFGLSDDHIYGL